MRIAYVCADPGVPVFGVKGCSVHVQEIVRALIRRGARVTLLARRLGGSLPADFESVRVLKIPRLPKCEDLRAQADAVREGNRALYDQLDGLAPFDALYERYSLWSYGALEYARSAGIPGILEVNAPLVEEQSRHRGLRHFGLAQEIAERVFRLATLPIAVSEEVREYVESCAGSGVDARVVPNGVDATRFLEAFERRSRDPVRPFTVGFLGTLKPWHGLRPLAAAFAGLKQRDPECRMLIVGDGPERESFSADLERRGVLDAVDFTGALEPDAVPAALARMDVGVAPYPASADFYFSPIKVFEYMAAGLPVVASRVGQLIEAVSHDPCGVLCPPGDSRSLCDALDALRRHPFLRREMGLRARSAALLRHSWDARLTSILEAVPLEVTPEFAGEEYPDAIAPVAGC